MPLLCSAVLFLLMTAANAAIMWGKINETGQYTTLHGITLISHVSNSLLSSSLGFV